MLKQILASRDAKLARIGLSIFLAGIVSTWAATSQAAAITVMCDSPLKPTLAKVVDLFQQDTHNQVNLVFDPSPAVKKD
jgi:molybdate transport system substrate-binding protein